MAVDTAPPVSLAAIHMRRAEGDGHLVRLAVEAGQLMLEVDRAGEVVIDPGVQVFEVNRSIRVARGCLVESGSDCVPARVIRAPTAEDRNTRAMESQGWRDVAGPSER